MPYKDRETAIERQRERRRRNYKPPGLCACGCGKPRRFGRGHEHRVYRPGGWNAHEPSWYAEQERRRA